MEKNYFVLYDLDDYVVCYLHDLKEFLDKFNYPLKEINRKFKNSNDNYIYLDINNIRYKLFCFN